MKHPLLWPVILTVITLYIAGLVFLDRSSSNINVVTEDRKPALVSGITCLTLGSGLLVLGIFMFRKRD
jgi:cell division protein FtsW (lipid II flippase)